MTIAEKITRAKTDYDEVYEAGKRAEYDAFWDAFQGFSGQETQGMFAGRGWTKETFKPKGDIKVKNGYMFFYNSNVAEDLSQILSDLGVKLDTSEMFNGQYMFWNSRFTRVPEIDIRSTTTTGQTMETFRTNSLITIDGIVTNETIVYNSAMFNGATNLKNLSFKGVIGSTINFQWCPLTKASITNVVEHLSSTATGQTCTFNKAAKEAAFTADEWAAFIADKTNWTFSLV